MATFRPTPDDGVRRSAERPWDETERPAVAASRDYDVREHAPGHTLVQVHDHLRSELTQILDLIDQVAAGRVSVGEARDAISRTTLRQNSWTLGAYCASYCRVVTTHHTIEDLSVFPHLRRDEPDLSPVVDRLEEEHRVIHAVLERLDAALVAMVAGLSGVAEVSGGAGVSDVVGVDGVLTDASPDGLSGVRAAVDLLSDTLLSHLSYEEHQLVEPLSRLGFV
jgi:hypothetical protein